MRRSRSNKPGAADGTEISMVYKGDLPPLTRNVGLLLLSRAAKLENHCMPTKKVKTSKSKRKPEPLKEAQSMTMYIAMVVRNEMEDFHVKHLSDEQMKELNPIIRNAICTALYAFENYDESVGAKAFVDFNVRLIPNYWEQPQLTESFLETVEYFERKADE